MRLGLLRLVPESLNLGSLSLLGLGLRLGLGLKKSWLALALLLTPSYKAPFFRPNFPHFVDSGKRWREGQGYLQYEERHLQRPMFVFMGSN